jgi:hypothetical protein
MQAPTTCNSSPADDLQAPTTCCSYILLWSCIIISNGFFWVIVKTH